MSIGKRKAIFERFADNLNLVKAGHDLFLKRPVPKEFETAVFCPLCMKMFNEFALNQRSIIPLTLEDVPPKSLGGKPKVLTCKKCNNTSGTKLDSQLLEFFKQKDFLKMKLNSKVEFKNMLFKKGEHSVRASGTMTHFKEKGICVKFSLKKNDPRHKHFLAVMNAEGEHEANFDVVGPSILSVECALLRIAYLICFEKFGHTFILNQSYNAIREQINKPAEEILEIRGMGNPDKNTYGEGIYIIREPKNLRGFIVVFPLRINSKEILYPVILPSPFIDAKQYYKALKEYAPTEKRFAALDRFTEVDFLSKEYCFEIVQIFRD